MMLREESREWQASPAHHRSESQLGIPRRVALQRSSSPLPQPSSSFTRTAETVHNKSANGECSPPPTVSLLGCTANCHPRRLAELNQAYS